jgi:hypothetical protein
MNQGELFTCWTDNCRGKADAQLYIIHGIREGKSRTLCGCNIQEFGERATVDKVSCKRCLCILSKNAAG